MKIESGRIASSSRSLPARNIHVVAEFNALWLAAVGLLHDRPVKCNQLQSKHERKRFTFLYIFFGAR